MAGVHDNSLENGPFGDRFGVDRRGFLKRTLAAGLIVGTVPALAGRTSAEEDGPVAYYPLDRTNGPVRDRSGNDLDGETLGDVTRGATGQVNDAFEFDGDDDGVEVPNEDGVFDLTDVWTVTAWVRPETSGSNFRNDPIVWKIARENTHEDTFALGWGSSDEDRFRTGLDRAADDTDFAVDSETHPPDNWYHVVGVYDGEALRIYVNGSEEGSTDAGDVTAYTGPAPLRVGNLLHSNHRPRGVFSGRIDEVRVYGRALSRGEVRVHERLGDCGLVPGDLSETLFDRLVEAAEDDDLHTVDEGDTGRVDLSADALFVHTDLGGNVDAENGVVVICEATVNGNVDVSDLVAVDARVTGNLQIGGTLAAFGDVTARGNLGERIETVLVGAGSTLRIDGNVAVDRLVIEDDGTLSVNGNLRCGSHEVASSADVNVTGNDDCT